MSMFDYTSQIFDSNIQRAVSDYYMVSNLDLDTTSIIKCAFLIRTASVGAPKEAGDGYNGYKYDRRDAINSYVDLATCSRNHNFSV